MTISELEIKTEAEIRLKEFEERTGLPARASLSELELMGGRCMTSKPLQRDGKQIIREYVIVDITGMEQEVAIYKREGEGDFMIHIEMETKNKY